MPRITKSKQNLQAQAALAQSSRNPSTSQNITQPSSQSSGPSSHPTPAVSPTPPDTPDVLSDEESDVQQTSENLYLYLPDIHVFEDLIPEFPEEEDGYRTDDDLSELEDDELEKSLKKQRVIESELVTEIGEELLVCLIRYTKYSNDRRPRYALLGNGKSDGTSEFITWSILKLSKIRLVNLFRLLKESFSQEG